MASVAFCGEPKAPPVGDKKKDKNRGVAMGPLGEYIPEHFGADAKPMAAGLLQVLQPEDVLLGARLALACLRRLRVLEPWNPQWAMGCGHLVLAAGRESEVPTVQHTRAPAPMTVAVASLGRPWSSTSSPEPCRRSSLRGRRPRRKWQPARGGAGRQGGARAHPRGIA